MKRVWSILLLTLAAVFSLAVGALAVGTVANTVINNTATVSYQNVGGANLTATSNTVSVTVQQVAAVAINTTQPTLSVTPGQTNVANYFIVTNNGNYPDRFDITVMTNPDPTRITNIRYMVNPVGTATSTTLDPGATPLTVTAGKVQTPYINSTPGLTLPATIGGNPVYPNGTVIFVVVDVPNTAPPGLVTKIQGANTVVSVFDATKSNATAVSMNDDVVAPSLTVTKQVRNVTAGGAFANTATGKPGDTLEYQIVITNTGTGPASNIVVTDILDPNTTFVAGSVTFVAGTGTAVEAGTSAPPNLVVNVGTGATNATGGSLNATQSVTFTFRVTIN